MNITEQMLNGEIPTTEEQLRFLAKNHEQYDLTRLDVSQITNFSELFKNLTDFNQDISGWDVSNGTDFRFMFSGAKYFNQPIGNWDVSNGTNFSYMFTHAKSFNQTLANWDVSNGTYFNGMFLNALSFNQPICNWNVSNGKDFSYMFSNALSFNQPVDKWDVSNVKEFYSIFQNATSFNQSIRAWKIKHEYFVQILESNFKLSIQHGFEKIGFTCNSDQPSLTFKGSPDCPFQDDFNYNAKELHLIKSNGFYGFMDENNNAYQIDTDKITIDELIEICDIKIC